MFFSLLFLHLLFKFVVSEHITGVFTSLESIKYEGTANRFPGNPSWIADLRWELDGSRMRVGDTFTLDMPCVFKFTTTKQSVNLISNSISYANCVFRSGEIHDTDSQINCVILPTIKDSSRTVGSLTIPFTFNAGYSSSEKDRKCAGYYKNGANTISFYDGNNKLSTQASFVGGADTVATTIIYSLRTISSLKKQHQYLLQGSCPNGYREGVLGMTILGQTGTIDCSTMAAYWASSLNDWYYPKTGAKFIYTYTCNSRKFRIHYSGIPRGYRAFIEGIVTREAGVKLRVEYENVFICHGISAIFDGSKTVLWEPYTDSDPGTHELEIVTQTWTGSTTTMKTVSYERSDPTISVIVEVPIPTTTITTSYVGISTSYTTYTVSPGETASVVEYSPYRDTTTESSCWDKDETTTSTIITSDQATDTILIVTPCEISSEDPSEDPSAEQPSTEDPSAEQPSIEQPSAEQPSIEQPSTEDPSTEQPSAEQPSIEQPSTEDPSAEQPSTEQPSTEDPSAEQPSTEESSTEQPTEGSTEEPEEPVDPSEPFKLIVDIGTEVLNFHLNTEGEVIADTGDPSSFLISEEGGELVSEGKYIQVLDNGRVVTTEDPELATVYWSLIDGKLDLTEPAKRELVEFVICGIEVYINGGEGTCAVVEVSAETIEDDPEETTQETTNEPVLSTSVPGGSEELIDWDYSEGATTEETTQKPITEQPIEDPTEDPYVTEIESSLSTPRANATSITVAIITSITTTYTTAAPNYPYTTVVTTTVEISYTTVLVVPVSESGTGLLSTPVSSDGKPSSKDLVNEGISTSHEKPSSKDLVNEGISTSHEKPSSKDLVNEGISTSHEKPSSKDLANEDISTSLGQHMTPDISTHLPSNVGSYGIFPTLNLILDLMIIFFA